MASLLSAPGSTGTAAPPPAPIPALQCPLAPAQPADAPRAFHVSCCAERPFHRLMHDGQLSSRPVQAPRDSAHGLEIVTTDRRTVDERRRAFEAPLRFQLEMRGVMIDTIHNAYRDA